MRSGGAISRAYAEMKCAWFGRAVGSAEQSRRRDAVVRDAVFSSLSRIVPPCALASSVPWQAQRPSAPVSANRSRLVLIGWHAVRSTNMSCCYTLIRFSMSPRAMHLQFAMHLQLRCHACALRCAAVSFARISLVTMSLGFGLPTGCSPFPTPGGLTTQRAAIPVRSGPPPHPVSAVRVQRDRRLP